MNIEPEEWGNAIFKADRHLERGRIPEAVKLLTDIIENAMEKNQPQWAWRALTRRISCYQHNFLHLNFRERSLWAGKIRSDIVLGLSLPIPDAQKATFHLHDAILTQLTNSSPTEAVESLRKALVLVTKAGLEEAEYRGYLAEALSRADMHANAQEEIRLAFDLVSQIRERVHTADRIKTLSGLYLSRARVARAAGDHLTCFLSYCKGFTHAVLMRARYGDKGELRKYRLHLFSQI